jgi:hypothetical protein
VVNVGVGKQDSVNLFRRHREWFPVQLF